MLKEEFGFENYLEILNDKNRITFCRFRTGNHKLPIESGRWSSVDKHNRKCNICNMNRIGDEFHYILECSELINERKQCLKKFYTQNINILKFKMLFQSKNVKTLRNICSLIRYINLKVCPPTYIFKLVFFFFFFTNNTIIIPKKLVRWNFFGPTRGVNFSNFT